MAPLMVQNFSEITDKRVLAYSAQILLNIMEVEFTTDQQVNFLKMHGFDHHLIEEVLTLSETMTERLQSFRLSI